MKKYSTQKKAEEEEQKDKEQMGKLENKFQDGRLNPTHQ